MFISAGLDEAQQVVGGRLKIFAVKFVSRRGRSHSDSGDIWMFPNIRGKTPKMDGENNGKPY